MKRLVPVLLFSLSLWAQSLFEMGKVSFEDGNYTAALSLFEQSFTIEGDEEAAYYLGKMYDEGLGTEADIRRSQAWYKLASQRYHQYALKEAGYESDKQRKMLVNSLDINDTETTETLEQTILSRFGLKAYRSNYFLPVSCGDYAYRSYVPSDSYSQCEAEIQLSLRYDIVSDLFGFGEIYSLAYTQHSYWQVYVDSAPFRETNYNPEFLITVPRNDSFGSVELKGLTFSIAHQSNGQGNITEQGLLDQNVTDSTIASENPEWLENRSRSWNYLSASAIVQYRSIFAELRAWLRINENGGDDNPDLIDYLGHGSLRVYYPYGKSVQQVLWRQNIKTGKGAVEVNWSYPFFNQISTYVYIKAFSGYAESLIDYNHYVNKAAIGLSFSR